MPLAWLTDIWTDAIHGWALDVRAMHEGAKTVPEPTPTTHEPAWAEDTIECGPGEVCLECEEPAVRVCYAHGHYCSPRCYVEFWTRVERDFFEE